MKLVLLLFFSFTLPTAIFLTTLVYGGVSNTVIKKELARSHIYSKIGSYISQINTDETAEAESQQFTSIITNRFTSTYIQNKIESAIDDSFLWVTGQSTTPPVISFKEVKEDMVTQNPELLSSLQEMAAEMKNQPVEESWSTGETAAADTETFKASEALVTLAKNDFSISLDTQLHTPKQAYGMLRIAHPILALLLLGTLILIAVLSQSWPSRFTWIGASLMTAGIMGLGIVLTNSFGNQMLAEMPIDSRQDLSAFVTPIAIEIIKHFLTTYNNILGIASVILLVSAAGCFIAAELAKPRVTIAPAVKVKTAKKK